MFGCWKDTLLCFHDFLQMTGDWLSYNATAGLIFAK